MKKELLNDLIQWDVVNWSKSLEFWTENVDLINKKFQCLELGAKKGGMSLWLALYNNDVICSDLNNPEKEASRIHKKYDYKGSIKYKSIDATNIIYKDTFDIVVFKSILGGISRNNNALKKIIIREIYKSLKPGGKLLFAENLEASFLHRFVKKTFYKRKYPWNYLKYNEIDDLFEDFKSVKYRTVGFFGVFGRTEKQRFYLGKLDTLCEKFIPKSARYIVIGIAEK